MNPGRRGFFGRLIGAALAPLASRLPIPKLPATVMGNKWLVTIGDPDKRLVTKVYHFADPKFIGKFFTLKGTTMSAPTPMPDLLDWHMAKLKPMLDLKEGWNGYSAQPPLLMAVDNAFRLHVLTRPVGLREPDRVAPSAMGGVAFTWRGLNHSRKVFVEAYNTGELHALFVDGDNLHTQKIAYEQAGMEAFARTAKTFLNSLTGPPQPVVKEDDHAQGRDAGDLVRGPDRHPQEVPAQADDLPGPDEVSGRNAEGLSPTA